MGNARTTINIECKTGSLWEIDNAVCVVRSAGSSVLRASQTRGNCKYRPLPRTNDQFEPRIDRKTPRMGSKTRQNHSAA